MHVRTGYLARTYLNLRLPLQVLRSQAGYYIGTADDEGPCSRESLEYYSSKEVAEYALKNNTFTQKEEP